MYLFKKLFVSIYRFLQCIKPLHVQDPDRRGVLGSSYAFARKFRAGPFIYLNAIDFCRKRWRFFMLCSNDRKCTVSSLKNARFQGMLLHLTVCTFSVFYRTFPGNWARLPRGKLACREFVIDLSMTPLHYFPSSPCHGKNKLLYDLETVIRPTNTGRRFCIIDDASEYGKS